MWQRAERNPFVNEFGFIRSNHWPLENQSVDICIFDNELEHIEDPGLFLSESQRILKRVGYLYIRTSNVLHYVALCSGLMSNRSDCCFLDKGRKKKGGCVSHPVRMQTPRKIGNMLDKYGFSNCVYGYEPKPAYLFCLHLPYLLVVIYQRFSPNILKNVIVAFGRNKA
jgi:ubiquinone/menaquinone biosynthesis C-methylase UbiE